MRDAAGEIERLRRLRGAGADRDPSIAPLIAATAREAGRRRQRLGAFIELWEGLVPARLAERSRVIALRGGVVHVAADSAPAAWELDRLLRGGLEAQLRAGFPATLTRVRISVESGAGPPG